MSDTEDIKKALGEWVDGFHREMKNKNYDEALHYADQIRNVGLSLGSDAWNTALEMAAK